LGQVNGEEGRTNWVRGFVDEGRVGEVEMDEGQGRLRERGGWDKGGEKAAVVG
jgi:hypothetical protein